MNKSRVSTVYQLLNSAKRMIDEILAADEETEIRELWNTIDRIGGMIIDLP